MSKLHSSFQQEEINHESYPKTINTFQILSYVMQNKIGGKQEARAILQEAQQNVQLLNLMFSSSSSSSSFTLLQEEVRNINPNLESM